VPSRRRSIRMSPMRRMAIVPAGLAALVILGAARAQDSDRKPPFVTTPLEVVGGRTLPLVLERER